MELYDFMVVIQFLSSSQTYRQCIQRVRFKWAHNPIYPHSLGRRQSGLCTQQTINGETNRNEKERQNYIIVVLFLLLHHHCLTRFLFLPPYSFNSLPMGYHLLQRLRHCVDYFLLRIKRSQFTVRRGKKYLNFFINDVDKFWNLKKPFIVILLNETKCVTEKLLTLTSTLILTNMKVTKCNACKLH